MSVGDLFHRVIEVQVGEPKSEALTSFTDLHIEFKVEKSLEKEPNTLDLKIYNLNATSRNLFKQKGARVQVLAGYGKVPKLIYDGEVRTAFHQHTDADWVTVVKAGDGDEAFRVARIDQAFGTHANPVDMIKEITKAMDLKVDQSMLSKLKEAYLAGKLTEFVKGLMLSGPAQQELDKLLKPIGFSFSIQDRVLQILADNDATQDTAVVLGPTTGLIGSPEIGETKPEKDGDKSQKKSFLKVRALLTPSIKPGCKVQMNSAEFKGLFRADRVVHQGSNFGQDFYTDVEMRAFDIGGAL